MRKISFFFFSGHFSIFLLFDSLFRSLPFCRFFLTLSYLFTSPFLCQPFCLSLTISLCSFIIFFFQPFSFCQHFCWIFCHSIPFFFFKWFYFIFFLFRSLSACLTFNDFFYLRLFLAFSLHWSYSHSFSSFFKLFSFHFSFFKMFFQFFIFSFSLFLSILFL